MSDREVLNDELQRSVHRDNLDREQRERFDVAMRELHDFREAAGAGRWEGGREHLDRAIENIEAVANHSSIGDHEREELREDIRHFARSARRLAVTLRAWPPMRSDSRG